VSLLARTIQNGYFIGVSRNPRMVVQSLILARQHIQGSKAFGWGLYSREDAVHSDPLGYVDDVCRQVVEMEAQLHRAQEDAGQDRFLEIDYDEFCLDPRRAVYAVSSLVPHVQVHEDRVTRELRPFKRSNELRLTPEEQRRMDEVFGRLSGTMEHIHGDHRRLRGHLQTTGLRDAFTNS
jgi:hypothetical protein